MPPRPSSPDNWRSGAWSSSAWPTAIDPFPRQPGAVLDWEVPSPGGDAAGAQNPFAVLARLKAKG